MNNPPPGWRVSSDMKALVALAVLLPLLVWVIEHMVLVKTRSINHYLVWKSQQPLQRGRFVLFSLKDWPAASMNQRLMTAQEDAWFNRIGGQLLVKRLGCQAGKQLTTVTDKQHSHYFCDGDSVTTAPAHPEHHFVFNGIVPESHAFVVGDHPQSLDSRYFGLVPLETAKRVLTTAELLKLNRRD